MPRDDNRNVRRLIAQARGAKAVAGMWICGIILSGCASSDIARGHKTPEAVAIAMARAVTAQDRTRLRRVFPSDGLLKEALECEGQENQVSRTRREREAVLRELDDDLANVSMEHLSTKQRKTVQIPKGTKKNGCEAKIDMELRRIQVKMNVTSEGQTHQLKELLTVVRFDKRGWFLVDH